MDEAREAPAEPGAATVVRPKRRPAKKKKPRGVPRWNVVLWNDEDHSFAYVIRMLRELFGHPPEKGFALAEEVDKRGKAVVLTTTQEHAELKRDQVHAYGKDDLSAGCAGSMTATIESVE